jgi:predicted nucleic-acid-binding protein
VIGLDSNVIVRYIMQDDVLQSAQATEIIEQLTESEPGFLTLVSVIEMVWVLEGAYSLSRQQVTEVLSNILKINVLKLEQASVVAAALRKFNAGKADFADCLIARLSAQAGCSKTLTFDRKAAQSAGMQLITQSK